EPGARIPRFEANCWMRWRIGSEARFLKVDLPPQCPPQATRYALSQMQRAIFLRFRLENFHPIQVLLPSVSLRFEDEDRDVVTGCFRVDRGSHRGISHRSAGCSGRRLLQDASG